MSSTYGLCPKYLELKQFTKHHIYPLRYYCKQKTPTYCYLCRECHDDLEYIISNREHGKKLADHVYLSILVSFLLKH